jgi:hypothetical protein
MSDPSLALQKALVAALRGETDAGVNVFDDVPTSDPFPRITLGEGQTIGDFQDCRDGSEVFIELNVWSRKVGFPEAKTIASQARTILNDADLDLDGHVRDLMEFQDTVYSRDPDGRTRRARMTLRALTQPE